MTLVILLFIQ